MDFLKENSGIFMSCIGLLLETWVFSDSLWPLFFTVMVLLLFIVKVISGEITTCQSVLLNLVKEQV